MEFSSLPERQRFDASRGLTYSYIYIPSKAQKPTILLLHGWPSHIDDWIYQITYFQPQGYGLLVPDLLGYGESSSSSDVPAYHLKLISQDLSELLNHVSLSTIIGVGHDWGATILSRFVLYHPDRVSATAFLAIGASKPGTPFNLDAINAMTKKATGSEMLGYVEYIARDPDSQKRMEENAESVMDVLFAAKPKTWESHFHPKGAFKKFVENGARQEVGSWFTHELRRRHLECFGREGGYLGPSRYYMALDQNISVDDERQFADFKIPVPTLLIVPETPAQASEMQRQMLAEWAPFLQVAKVEGGHWVHIERHEEVNFLLNEFIEESLPS